jgi:hypothetical protein
VELLRHVQAQSSQDSLSGDAVDSLLDPVNPNHLASQMRNLVAVLAVFKEQAHSEVEHCSSGKGNTQVRAPWPHKKAKVSIQHISKQCPL